MSDYLTAYIEPTFQFTENFGFYVKGGVSTVTINTLENLALGDDSSTYGNVDVMGGMWGIGIKGTHSSGVFLKLEGLKTHFESVALSSNTGNKNTIQAVPRMESVRVAIGYKF